MNLCGLNTKAFGVGEGVFFPLFSWEPKKEGKSADMWNCISLILSRAGK